MKDHIFYRLKRQAMGLSLADVAKLAGISTTTVTNFEDPVKSEKVSEPYRLAIKNALLRYSDQTYPATLKGARSYETPTNINIILKALALDEKEISLGEKLDLISDLQINLAYLQKDILKFMKDDPKFANKSGVIIEEGNRPLRIFSKI